jgi:hypothetical protein
MRETAGFLFAVLIFMLGSPGDTYSFQEEQAPFSEESVSIEDLINYAYQKNPAIRAARQAWRATLENFRACDRATLLDMSKTQSQLGQLYYDIVLLNDLEETEITRLNTILNRAPGARIGPLQPIPARHLRYDLEQLYQMAEKKQEDTLVAERPIEKARTKVDLARLENRPDFNVGLFYGSIGNPDIPQQPMDTARDAVGIQFGMTIPIWS